ncbi:hypothetical protein D3C72_1357670 [compost metagenome]
MPMLCAMKNTAIQARANPVHHTAPRRNAAAHCQASTPAYASSSSLAASAMREISKTAPGR